MEYISNVLFWIANGLMVPVIVGLLYFFIRSVLMLGAFFNLYLQYSKQSKTRLKKNPDSITKENINDFVAEMDSFPQSHFTFALKSLIGAKTNAVINRILAEYEVKADSELGKYKILTKFGPILGLMGTLIPMGPALAGLATGDVASMAYNMQIAFATTVIGLFAGAIGYILLQVRQRWFVAELSILEFIADICGNSDERHSTL
ncbi:membrane protein [Porphyromonadaceae bacterium COT-184 OH4590]|nr:membrane protein [Porphyromonadaceae bacterium COT-184 OH4590]